MMSNLLIQQKKNLLYYRIMKIIMLKKKKMIFPQRQQSLTAPTAVTALLTALPANFSCGIPYQRINYKDPYFLFTGILGLFTLRK